ncbi:MAG TPA: hypothetical protein VNI83_04545 [Vicinamibacterales bacterium]|nr:hypothetical protein [Vicinamibacterales bacterium]
MQLDGIVTADGRALTIGIAGLVLRLEAPPGEHVAVSGATRRFLIDHAPPDVTLAARRARRLVEPEAAPLFDSGAAWRLYRTGQATIFSLRAQPASQRRREARRASPYCVATFDRHLTRGTVAFDRRAVREGQPLEPLAYPLDELLVIHLLARGRGLEIHGCGVVDRDGRAYLCAGPSGAGKTTIARLWQAAGATVLSDDRVIVRRHAGRFWLYGTPWHGDARLASPLGAPLARILHLARGPRHELRALPPAEAAARLLACSFPPFHDAAGMRFTLDCLAALVAQVPGDELRFVPEPGVAAFVREAA